MDADVIAAFRRAVEAGDSEAVLATLVPRVLDTWKNLRYVAELHGDGLIGLIFDAEAGSEKAHGIDVLRLNGDGLIGEITQGGTVAFEGLSTG